MAPPSAGPHRAHHSVCAWSGGRRCSCRRPYAAHGYAPLVVRSQSMACLPAAWSVDTPYVVSNAGSKHHRAPRLAQLCPPKARSVPGSHGQAICASSGRSSNPGATGRRRDQPCGQHAHSVATSLPPSSADGERNARAFESYGGRSAWWPHSAGRRRRWSVSSRSAFARCDGAPFVCTFRARESFRVGELSSIITDLVRCRAEMMAPE